MKWLAKLFPKKKPEKRSLFGLGGRWTLADSVTDERLKEMEDEYVRRLSEVLFHNGDPRLLQFVREKVEFVGRWAKD